MWRRRGLGARSGRLRLDWRRLGDDVFQLGAKLAARFGEVDRLSRAATGVTSTRPSAGDIAPSASGQENALIVRDAVAR